MKKYIFVIAFCGIFALTNCGGGNSDPESEWADPTYKWSDNYDTCVATRVNKKDASLTEKETSNSTYELITPPTCEVGGLGKYTATFTNIVFETQYHEVTFDPTGHDFGDPIYTWSQDYTTCNAKRICKHDASHVENETVNTEFKVIISPTCETEGSGKYQAKFKNPAFTMQEHNVTIDPTGHRWDTPTYSWATNYSSCTAQRVCLNNPSHKETETKNSTYKVVTEPTCEKDGLATYTVTFTNTAFAKQTHDVTLDPLDHDWGDPTYTWSTDNSTCTAQRVCKRDASHKQTETKNSSSQVIKAPTYTETGVTRYTVSFTNTAFASQTKDVDTPVKSKLKFTKYSTYCKVEADSTSIPGEITIPEYYEGLPVTTIGSFYNCQSITSVNIPNTTTTISANAFQCCSSLESITLPEGLNTIGDFAFSEAALKSVTVPSTVTSIGFAAFGNNAPLETVVFKDGITDLGVGSLYNSTAIKTLTVPYIGQTATSEKYLGVLFSIGAYGWLSSNYNVPESLKTLIVSDACTSIDNHALDGCAYIESITLPFVGGTATTNQFLGYIYGGTTADDETVKVPATLKEVILSSKCTKIADKAFNNCASLEEVTLPSTLKTIGYRSFYGCTSIESLVVPESVTTIGDSAFGSMTSLLSIKILGANTQIGATALSECTSLVNIEVSKDSPYYKATDNVLYSKDGKTLICYPAGKVDTSFTIPDGVTKIEEFAFYKCGNLNTVTIPTSVNTINNNAFCLSNITSITIPEGVSIIAANTFNSCAALKTVTLPSTIKEIKDYGFGGCTSLEMINLPNGLTTLGKGAFYSDAKLQSIQLPSTLTTLGEGVFGACSILNNITVPSSVTAISNGCFMECPKLSNITIPSNLKSIGESAFYNDASLKSINLPYEMDIIGAGAFEGCSALESITIPEEAVIADYAFHKCASLSSIEFAVNEYSIGYGAFAECPSLTEVIIGGECSTIGDYAFAYCSNLVSVGISYSVTSIGEYCFYNDTKLTNLAYGDTKSQWQKIQLGQYWDGLTLLYKVVCTDGDIIL